MQMAVVSWNSLTLRKKCLAFAKSCPTSQSNLQRLLLYPKKMGRTQKRVRQVVVGDRKENRKVRRIAKLNRLSNSEFDLY